MLRPMNLQGWYPFSKEQCIKEIQKLINPDLFIEGRIPVAAVVPHAGWYFSGHLAVNCIRILKEKNGLIKNVVIFGGHLSEVNLAVFETFEKAQTPLGELASNRDIIDLFRSEDKVQFIDYLEDNTIEVLLPIVHYFFGSSIKINAIYLPPHIKITGIIDKISGILDKNTVFIGSTDLTHYGPNYSFTHNDKKITAVDWVKNINDKNYIAHLVDMNEAESIAYAIKNKSACSAGAALGAMLAAKKRGVKKGELLGYSTSYDKHKDTSFVGYTGILY